MKKTSVFENGLIWFGAAISIAEILTGTYYAPMGFKNGFIAILIGHLIGFIFLYLSGLIGALSKRSAMETTKLTFGSKGGKIFSLLNFLQLLGWTAIMIYDGASSSSEVFSFGHNLWAILIGVLIIVWLMVGLSDLGKLKTISLVLLFILTIILSRYIFKEDLSSIAPSSDAMSFGAAIELAIAMPISWLPLISDYTSKADKGKKSTFVSALVYSLVSIWMYVIGMGGSLITGETSLASIFSITKLGVFAVVIIILSTVNTTFMDAYSSGITFKSIKLNSNEKRVGVIVTIIGTIGAMIFPMDNISNFLYFIGSVFAPMIAIQIADYFILKNEDFVGDYNILNIVSWIFGFIIYRLILNEEFIIGPTLLVIIITMIITIILNKAFGKKEFDN